MFHSYCANDALAELLWWRRHGSDKADAGPMHIKLKLSGVLLFGSSATLILGAACLMVGVFLAK